MQQLWTVLGPDGSKYVIWLGVGLALLLGVSLVIWLLMKIFGRSLNLSGGNGRGQPQRLGITGAFNVDRSGLCHFLAQARVDGTDDGGDDAGGARPAG